MSDADKRWNKKEWLPLAAAAFLFVITIVILQRDLQLARTAQFELEQYSQLERFSREIVQLLTDAETGQRGYVLTGRSNYLEPYDWGLRRLPEVREGFLKVLRLLPAKPVTEERINRAVEGKIEILVRTVRDFDEQGKKAASIVVDSEMGKERMDEVRRIVAEVEMACQTASNQRVKRVVDSLARAASFSSVLGLCTCVLLGIGTRRLVGSLARSESLVTKLEVQEEQYRQLALSLQKVDEEQRAAMARKVHDEIGQNLTAAKIDISMGLRKLDQNKEGGRSRLDSAIGLLDETIQIARNISTELRPPILDQAGLLAAIEWQLVEFERRTGIHTSAPASASEPGISREAKVAIFRVFQEALTNVARHAKARRVSVEVHQTVDKVAIDVVDDGVGMETAHASVKSLGILGMRERMRVVGGELQITSERGKGSRITVQLPVEGKVWPEES